MNASDAELRAKQLELERINEELKKHTEALERERNRLLALENQLRGRTKELEIANRYKAQFLATVSHELRTPLNSILILTEVLHENRTNTLAPNQLHQLEIIHQSGKSLLSIIDDILDLSRVEAGKLNLQIGKVRPASLVNELMELFSEGARKKNLHLVVNFDSQVPAEVVTDGMRLAQILKNFVANALKFTEQGQIQIRVHCPKSEDFPETPASHWKQGQVIAFTVSDTGIGIPMPAQKEIFLAFRQADPSTTRRYGGSGLGLAICAELARLLGSIIVLDSLPGRGSSFTLLIQTDINSVISVQNESTEPIIYLTQVEKNTLPARDSVVEGDFE